MQTIYRSEASASLRRIPLWIVDSTGTGPISASGGQPQIAWLARGGTPVNTAATLSLVSANAGEHYIELSASEVSALGVLGVHYRSATAIPASAYAQVVNYDSGDSMRLGQMSLPNAAPGAANGLLAFGSAAGQINPSTGSVSPIFGDYSSIVTVGTGIIAASVARSNASSLLSTDMGNSRLVQEAFFALRNKVSIEGSTMTVFKTDDTTSSWTASTTTGDFPLSGIDPIT